MEKQIIHDVLNILDEVQKSNLDLGLELFINHTRQFYLNLLRVIK